MREKKPKHMKTIPMCKKCYTFYYERAWHQELPAELKGKKDEHIIVMCLKCASCRAKENILAELSADLIFG